MFIDPGLVQHLLIDQQQYFISIAEDHLFRLISSDDGFRFH